MTPPLNDAGFVRMPEAEFEAMLARAAEQGARRALADVGLEGPDAAIDIRDLRTLLESLRMARRTAWQTIIRVVVTGLACPDRGHRRQAKTVRLIPASIIPTHARHPAGFSFSGGPP